LSGFLPSFILSTKCYSEKRLEFSCFADFLNVFLKLEKSLVFFKKERKTVNSMDV
jgi:hypothetical protein